MKETEELQRIIEAGDVGALRTMLDGGWRPASSGPGSEQPSWILAALYRQQVEIAELLRGAGVPVHWFEAAALGDCTLLDSLLQDGHAEVGQVAADGFTALHLAAFFGREAAVERLLAAGAEVAKPADNPSGVHPLHSAMVGGHRGIAGQLLAAGADPDARQAGGYTALHSAARHGDVQMVELLLAAGADPALRSENGESAADFAEAAGHEALASRLSS